VLKNSQNRTPRAGRLGPFIFLLALATATIPARAQTASRFPARATNYNVEATLIPAEQKLSAKARVDFVADQTTKTLLVELHRDLKISAVRDASGKALEFDRNADRPLDVRVNLNDALTPGSKATVTFEYAGPVSIDEDSPTKGLRLASVEKDSAYLLLPARWFPLTNFPSNRYTYNFKIIVPDTFYVVGTGNTEPVSVATSPQGESRGQALYSFHSDRPSPGGTFVAGSLQLSPQRIEGLKISVFTPPAAAGTAAAYASSLGHVINYFSEQVGPLPEPSMTIAQFPDGSLPAYAAPGLILISARQWSSKVNELQMAQLAAEQWWNDSVMPASASDVWLSDGLSRYSGAMYAEEAEGESGLRHALEDFSVGTLMYEDAAPIGQAQRLESYSDSYRSVVENKGAMVFHMLRSQIGDSVFRAVLKDYYAKFAGKSASLDDFEKIVQAKAPATVAASAAAPAAPGAVTPAANVSASAAPGPALNLQAFFAQWLNSTGIPEFKLNYIVYRTRKGFKIVGKVTQELDTFKMPVELKVDTEGNPEIKAISVAGTASAFEIETFGRPKPNGLTLDPNNNLLKSSGRLRVRAAVARGEGLAAQGKFYEAIQEYQHALELQPNNSLAHFRLGEALFFQKNYQAAANAFRSSLDGDLDTSYKWVEVWSHIYIGKIYDLTGQRERAVNEYSRAQQLGDDTGGAQAEAQRYLKKPYSDETEAPATAKS